MWASLGQRDNKPHCTLWADRRPKWPPRPRLAPLLWRPRLWLLLRLPGLWFDVRSLTHDLLKLSLAHTQIVRRRVLPVIGTLPVGALCRKPVRAPLPAHLPRERVVVPAPCSRPRCGGKLAKLGEDITETLEVIPRQRKVIQTVRERFSCRACETVTQPPAPFHPIARGRAGASLLAMILDGKFGPHDANHRGLHQRHTL